MRISDWSSDVCSSDLADAIDAATDAATAEAAADAAEAAADAAAAVEVSDEAMEAGEAAVAAAAEEATVQEDRKSVVTGKSVAVRGNLGGRRSIKQQKRQYTHHKMWCICN